jgi:uncharacterized protein YjaG (DUF416 family)
MNYQEFIPLFKKQVSVLPYGRQLEFAFTISNKLFPEYKAFSEFHNWGSPLLLLDAINMIESYLLTNSIEKEKIEEMKTKIDPIIPHMDDFGDDIGSYGLYASAAVYETLDFLLNKNQDHITISAHTIPTPSILKSRKRKI